MFDLRLLAREFKARGQVMYVMFDDYVLQERRNQQAGALRLIQKDFGDGRKRRDGLTNVTSSSR